MVKKFTVGGMTCSACSQGIERNVKKLNGVYDVSVSLMSKQMTVDFDDRILSNEIIIATVEKLGYTAYEFGTKKEDKFYGARKLKKDF